MRADERRAPMNDARARHLMVESVWKYPRPPRLEHVTRHVRVVFGGVVIAESRRPARVLETSHPPVYYVCPEDILREHLVATARTSFCEWKGAASYCDVQAGGKLSRDAAWTYRAPTEAFLSIRDWVAFYPGRMDECTLDGEIVRAQAGGFYGGWITSDIEGPFKGDPGTEGW
jgi:uncharacterized protein (DUF427 family)